MKPKALAIGLPGRNDEDRSNDLAMYLNVQQSHWYTISKNSNHAWESAQAVAPNSDPCIALTTAACTVELRTILSTPGPCSPQSGPVRSFLRRCTACNGTTQMNRLVVGQHLLLSLNPCNAQVAYTGRPPFAPYLDRRRELLRRISPTTVDSRKCEPLQVQHIGACRGQASSGSICFADSCTLLPEMTML